MLHEQTATYKINNAGYSALSDVEVIASIIAKGETPGAFKQALEIAQKLFQENASSLHTISRLSVKDLQVFMSAQMAVKLSSAFEFARRKSVAIVYDKPKISTSRDAYRCINTQLADLYHEEFWILCISNCNEVICKKQIAIGGVAGVVADIKIIMKTAIQEPGCAAIIAVHNHPSGNLAPSNADVKLTRDLKEAGNVLQLPLLDHLIVSVNGYYSFADEGII